MNFDPLPAQPRLNAGVNAYSDECFRRSIEAIAVTRNERDIAYGTQPRQTLDLFLPADRDALDLPVLFFLHRGGWSIGYKEWCGFGDLRDRRHRETQYRETLNKGASPPCISPHSGGKLCSVHCAIGTRSELP